MTKARGPYPFQGRVGNYLLNGRSVVLQAPTGSGKTAAALLPFLHARRRLEPKVFPRQCLYSVPLRVLVNQFEDHYKELVRQAGWEDVLHVTVQTGDRPEDPKFRGDLIFTTIDQTLSSILGVPYALSRRQANLNAGAVIGSYLVFDEFHLFPAGDGHRAEGALVTTIHLLRLLKGITPFVLMTATFSSRMLADLAQLLEAEVVTVSPEELAQIPSQQGKVRRYHVADGCLTADAVLKHLAHRTLVLCNTVERAQALYQDLVPHLGRERVILLHSRFEKGDREAKEERVRREFGKDRAVWSQEPLILVATQVVEVGLDITSQVLHTEIAPANSLFQRAGRCARFEGEQGEVVIYSVPPNRQGEPNYLPYDADLCRRTWEAFQMRNGKTLNFPGEQEMIDAVHAEADRRMLQVMKATEGETWDLIARAIGLGDPSVRSRLIRRVDSRVLLVHDTPETLENPFACRGFAIWPGSLKGKLKELKGWQEEKGLPWALQHPVEVEGTEEASRLPVRYRWELVKSVEDLDRSVLFVIHPGLATYDPDIGFRFDPAGGSYRTTAQPPRRGEWPEDFAYELESYTEHIRQQIRYYRRELSERLAYVAARLEELAELPHGGLDLAIRLAITLHDVGKMDTTWQAWARRYQEVIGEPVPSPAFLIAHTHYDPRNPRHRTAGEAVLIKRPPHAAEGAIAVTKLVHHAVGGHEGLRRIVLTAIARHHDPRTENFSQYKLEPAAREAVLEALRHAGISDEGANTLFLRPPVTSLSHQILGQLGAPGGKWEWWLAYFLVTRSQRLADQFYQEG